MAIILNIDTAGETAYVNIAKDGYVFAEKINTAQKDHAAFLQPAIKELAEQTSITLNQIDAIAVAEGPGSYTGLRVGMASVKGLCYALKKPLIHVNSLEILAYAAKTSIKENNTSNVLFCPMIDARRMEVFTAVYDYEMKTVMPTAALILEKNSFAEMLATNSIYFNGSGSVKWNTICKNDNAHFIIDAANTVAAMSSLSYKYFLQKKFSDFITATPAYIKDFHTGVK